MPLTPAERSAAEAELTASRGRMLAALSGLSDEEWGARRSPEGWSIAECAEHITAAELPMARFVEAASPGPPWDDGPARDEAVRRLIRDRSQRAEAPERVRPKGRWMRNAEIVRTFEERRRANIEYVRTTQEDLRGRFLPHPFAGRIDCYQWILSLAAHTERHTAQIEEIRRDSGLERTTGET